MAPASCSTVASTVMARQPSSRAHSRTRSARGARSGSVPSRAAAPNGSRPRLPPTDSRPPTWSSRARAAAGWSVTDETTTGARSSRTSASASGRSATARPSAPTCSHTEVTPCSRSSSTAARVAATSGSSCSWRTSHGVLASRSARPRVNGIAPGTPRSLRGSGSLAQVEGVDLEAALEVAAQGRLGLRAVEPVVVGAALVEHRGDEALPVLATLLREAGREAGRRAGGVCAGTSEVSAGSGRPTRPSSCSLPTAPGSGAGAAARARTPSCSVRPRWRGRSGRARHEPVAPP